MFAGRHTDRQTDATNNKQPTGCPIIYHIVSYRCTTVALRNHTISLIKKRLLNRRQSLQSADHSYCLHKMQTIVHIVFVTNIFVALAIAVTIFSPVSSGPVRVSVGLLVGMITGHRRNLRLRPSSFLLSVLKSNSTVHYWYFYEQWLQMNIDFSNKVARSLHFYSYFNALLTLPTSMRSRVYETVQRLSICPSVCLIDRQQQRWVYCWAPGRQEIPIAPCASAQQQRCRSTALSSKCGQRHVESRRRIL